MIIQVSYYYPAIGEVVKEDYDYSVILALGSVGISNGRFNVPNSVAFDSMGYIYVGIDIDSLGNVYVADTGNSHIQKFASNGTSVTKWGTECGCYSLKIVRFINFYSIFLTPQYNPNCGRRMMPTFQGISGYDDEATIILNSVELGNCSQPQGLNPIDQPKLNH